MLRMAIKLTVAVLALSSVSCSLANGLMKSGSRLLQSVGRTVGV